MSKQEFKDSVEATEFLEKLQEMVNDPRLENWCANVDDFNNVETQQPMIKAKLNVNEMVNKIFDIFN